MWWFKRRKAHDEIARKEALAQKINSDSIQKLNEAVESTKKLNELLESDGGVTQLIFLATGGDRRVKR